MKKGAVAKKRQSLFGYPKTVSFGIRRFLTSIALKQHQIKAVELFNNPIYPQQ